MSEEVQYEISDKDRKSLQNLWGIREWLLRTNPFKVSHAQDELCSIGPPLLSIAIALYELPMHKRMFSGASSGSFCNFCNGQGEKDKWETIKHEETCPFHALQSFTAGAAVPTLGPEDEEFDKEISKVIDQLSVSEQEALRFHNMIELSTIKYFQRRTKMIADFNAKFPPDGGNSARAGDIPRESGSGGQETPLLPRREDERRGTTGPIGTGQPHMD